MKKILLWGVRPTLPKDLKFEELYKLSGNNIGNFLITNGITSVLDGYEYITRSDINSPEEANEKCERIIIPAANWLWKNFDFGYMADFLNSTNIPITMIGLGAQTNDRSTISEIHPNTLRLIKIISERSPSIGVRGYYTAEVLSANGISNVSVIGCPSLYTKKIFTPISEFKGFDSCSKYSINFSRRVSQVSFDQKKLNVLENTIFSTFKDLNTNFVLQDELQEASLFEKQTNENNNQQIIKYFNKSAPNEVLNFFEQKTKIFTNYSDWSNYLSFKDFSIGSRLHGNLIALMNGTPSLTIIHDSRTLEVAALTGCPNLNIKTLDLNKINKDLIIEKINSLNFEIFNKNMQNLFIRARNFYDLHKLNHSIGI